LAIGGKPGGKTNKFRGIVDDVRIYDYGLSAQEVGWLASGGTGLVVLQSIADIYTETPPAGAVNLKDFAKLGDSWLEERLYPE
jgi:hypothetical protein